MVDRSLAEVVGERGARAVVDVGDHDVRLAERDGTLGGVAAVFSNMLFLLFVEYLTVISGIPDQEDAPDFYVLLLGSTLGMMLMVSANHLLMVFLAVEMTSVPSYAMVGFLKGRRKSSEAALKYVVYGAGAAGIMLYGISLLSGLSQVKALEAAESSRCRWIVPHQTSAIRSSGSIRTSSSLKVSRCRPRPTDCPASEVPAPRAVRGMAVSLHARTAAWMSSRRSATRTASGTIR
jgi:hypothetical protein